MKRQVWAGLTRASSKPRASLTWLRHVSLQHLELCPHRTWCGLAVNNLSSPAPGQVSVLQGPPSVIASSDSRYPSAHTWGRSPGLFVPRHATSMSRLQLQVQGKVNSRAVGSRPPRSDRAIAPCPASCSVSPSAEHGSRVPVSHGNATSLNAGNNQRLLLCLGGEKLRIHVTQIGN